MRPWEPSSDPHKLGMVAQACDPSLGVGGRRADVRQFKVILGNMVSPRLARDARDFIKQKEEEEEEENEGEEEKEIAFSLSTALRGRNQNAESSKGEKGDKCPRLYFGTLTGRTKGLKITQRLS